MSGHRFIPALSTMLVIVGVGGFMPTTADAHCDTMDGPVVTAARLALEKNEVARVLIWVQKQDEQAIRTAFEQTRSVRGLGPKARDLADMYFFETLVRLHRAGEGAPYTGLKPAGSDLGPAIPGADRALETGDVAPLVRLVVGATEAGLRERFAVALAARGFVPGDVEAGRGYIEKYVPFLHYVERLYESATTSAPGHEAEAETGAQHQE